MHKLIGQNMHIRCLRPKLFSRPTLQLIQCRLLSRDARSDTRWPEQRLGPDGKLYTVDKFSALFGRDQWQSAHEERRRDTDGVAYTLPEFEDFYGGDSDGVAYKHWDMAKHWAHKLTKELAAAPTIRDLLDMHKYNAEGLNHVHLPTIWFRIGKLSKGRERQWLRRNEDQLRPLQEHTMNMLPELHGQGLANTSYALAQSNLWGRQPWKDLWVGLSGAAQERLPDFNPQSISNTAWAFATAKHPAPELFDAIAAQAARRLPDFNPQDISNTARRGLLPRQITRLRSCLMRLRQKHKSAPGLRLIASH